MESVPIDFHVKMFMVLKIYIFIQSYSKKVGLCEEFPCSKTTVQMIACVFITPNWMQDLGAWQHRRYSQAASTDTNWSY